MKLFTIGLTIAAMAAGLSCASSGGATSAPQAEQVALVEKSQPTNQRPAKAPSMPGPTIPKDAQWTILCATITGPNHAASARAARANLIAQTKMPDWYTVTSEGETTLYYGFYRSINDPKDAKESARAQNDRKTIAALTDPSGGTRLFSAVLLTKLDAPDPASPPEWDLTSAKGTYSLQVAVYKDSADRRAAAVEAVRSARAAGYEAYYFHGPSASSVCIGAWPETAVRESNQFNVKQMANPNAVPLVAPGDIPLGAGEQISADGQVLGADGKPVLTPDGKPIIMLRGKFEILEPQLMAIMKKFPTHSVNGVVQPMVMDPRTGQKRLAPAKPSFLVRIPRVSPQPAQPAFAERGAPDPIQAAKTPDPAPAPQDAPAPALKSANPPLPKGGKLRSLDDR
jgi:hypothetical protein